MTDMKMQDRKIADQMAEHKIALHEKSQHGIAETVIRHIKSEARFKVCANIQLQSCSFWETVS